MKKTLLTLILALSVFNLHANEKEKAFEQSFLDAVATSDEATFALVEFNGSTPKMFDEAFKNQLIDIRKRGIKEIEFVDAKEADVIEFTHEGVDYTSTLPIEKRLKESSYHAMLPLSPPWLRSACQWSFWTEIREG